MSRLSPRIMMFLIGIATIGAMAIFLTLYEGSPGPLSAPHAAVIRGSTIFSCKQCHAEEGLTDGCLNCHVEIAGPLEANTGYHAHLLKDGEASCEECHSEHFGAEFPLVSELSWKDQTTNTFNHPHVEFNLTGKHDKLACGECHEKKLAEPFALPDFPKHQRASTLLGLEQECLACHEDVHKSGEQTRDCLRCHDQNAFKPAANFSHDKYFVLEGVHAKAACSACHQTDGGALFVNQDSRIFGPVKGKACADCHKNPHRFDVTPQQDCIGCHLGDDENWTMGRRGIDPQLHATFGFALTPPHADRDCKKCHQPDLPYVERYPDSANPGYTRRPDQCRGCHEDPHGGQFIEKHPACLECHRKDRFIPSNLGPGQHSETYPLQGAHQAVACIQCHIADEATEVRQFTTTVTACKDCHENPHKEQFRDTLLEDDCTTCHLPDSSTFRIHTYEHKTQSTFFLGKKHREVSCKKCHPLDSGEEVVVYKSAPTTCAACHQDTHRGQFLQNGTTDCERCHGTTKAWNAENFVHNRDSRFTLEAAHAKADCAACHLPVQQPDGNPVVQYRPLTMRCEDCHGFTSR